MTSEQLTSSSNKSLRLTALIGKVHLDDEELKQKEALETPKVGNTSSTPQENASKYYGDTVVNDGTDICASQAPYQNCTTENEEVESSTTPNFTSYQLQQWMLETSNSCITLAEKLEKSKWQSQSSRAEHGPCGDDCDENWGRKAYDWILFNE